MDKLNVEDYSKFVVGMAKSATLECSELIPEKMKDGTVKAGGLREFIPLMGKIAIISGVDAIFMEVHNRPEEAKCDGPCALPLSYLEDFLKQIKDLDDFIKDQKDIEIK